MKRCPKCNLNYTDDTLEFCLEDGSRLVKDGTFESEIQTVARSKNPDLTTAKTVALPFSIEEKNRNLSGLNNPQSISQKPLLKEKALRQSQKALEIAPIAFALAHNWWQWIYLNNQYYSSFVSYILSANFLM